MCGLKLCKEAEKEFAPVTPCVGVWIETVRSRVLDLNPTVTPCVGVWIETNMASNVSRILGVTPCVGVWIETYTPGLMNELSGHTLRGCVD